MKIFINNNKFKNNQASTFKAFITSRKNILFRYFIEYVIYKDLLKDIIKINILINLKFNNFNNKYLFFY